MEQLLAFVVNISICFVILTGHAVDRQYSPYTRCRTSFKCCGTAGKIYYHPSLFDCSFYLLQQIYLSKKFYSAYRMSDQSSSYLFWTPFSCPSLLSFFSITIDFGRPHSTAIDLHHTDNLLLLVLLIHRSMNISFLSF